MADDKERQIADRLFQARASCIAIPPVRDDLGTGGIEAAYRIQRLNIDRLVQAGASRVGRKIGLTSTAVQQQLGVDSPDFGVLLDSMAWRGNTVAIPVSGMIAPRIEAEIAFVLGADITSVSKPETLMPFIGGVAASAEIVDSAIANWTINILDTVADNASSGRFAVGAELPFIESMNLPARQMILRRDGETVSTGAGAATLGDPLNALAWLAETAIAFGDPLRAGDVILAGALGPMTPFIPATYEIEIEGFPKLTVTATP